MRLETAIKGVHAPHSMPLMSRTLGFKKAAVVALSILALTVTGSLTGCSKKKSPTSLPAGTQLMADGATAMSNVQSAHFVLTVDGQINGLALSRAEGDLTKEGKAKGTATIDSSGIKVEAAFVIVDQSLYLKLATGGYQKLPLAVAATVYDPSAILDPNRGVAQLLRTAKNPK